MTYIIKKNGRRYNSKTYQSYEQARSYVRKILRNNKDVACGPVAWADAGWIEHNNPSHSRYGFSIERKEASKDGTCTWKDGTC